MDTLRFFQILSVLWLAIGLIVSWVAAEFAVRTDDRQTFVASMRWVQLVERAAVFPALLLTMGLGVGLVVTRAAEWTDAWLLVSYVTLALIAVLPILLSVQAHRTALQIARAASNTSVPVGARAPLLTPTYRLYRPSSGVLTILTVALIIFRPS